MNNHNNFSFARFWAILLKEFIHLWRDKGTFAMMMGIPLVQLIVFGFAINMNPKHLPTAIVSAEHSIFTRSFIRSLENSSYFDVIYPDVNKTQADLLLKQGRSLFVLTIPPNFSRDLIRGQRPQLLFEADATDPVAVAAAKSTVQSLAQTAMRDHFKGSLQTLAYKPPAFDLVIHARYNPLSITQYNIIPGLLGVILTSSLTIVTAIALTRERERGTMENLLSTPVQPLEVILGKIMPYITIGYAQVVLILLAARFLFHVPMGGNIALLFLLCLPFIAANLAVGLTFSTLAKNQLQAVQSAMFFFLPSILLSGFMFPFLGMPQWAQWVGNILPLTHFVIITRGLLLKNVGFFELWPQLSAILLFMTIAIIISIVRFRRTLD